MNVTTTLAVLAVVGSVGTGIWYLYKVLIGEKGLFLLWRERYVRSRPRILRQQPTNFVDRTVELQQISDALVASRIFIFRRGEKQQRVVLLHGMGGVGKTDLAIEAAYRLLDRFPDGVVWQFVGQSSVDEMLNIIATAFEILVSGLMLSQKKIMVQKALTNKRVLLIFDNAEQSGPISEVLDVVSPCAVIITSRAAELGTTKAQRIDVKELPLEGAVELFARTMGRDLDTAERKSAEEICVRVGRLPLAVVLASSQAQILRIDLDHLLRRIDQAMLNALQFQMSGGRSVWAAFESTYQSLNSDDQVAFALLGVFSEQGFSLDAIQAVNTDPEAEDRLLDLVALSLVRPLGEARYLLHPLLKLYAQEKLKNAVAQNRPIKDVVSEKVTPERVDLAKLRQILDAHFSESELQDLCFDLNVEYSNLPGQSKSNKAGELVGHLERRGRISELVEIGQRARPDVSWKDVFEVSREATSTYSDILFERLSNACQRMAAYYLQFARKHQQDFNALELERPNILIAMDWAQQAEQWSVVVGLTEALLGSDAYFGFWGQRGYWEESVKRTRQALEAATQLGDATAEARFSADLGLFYYWQGKNDDARPYYQAILTRLRSLGNTRPVILVLHRLGFIEDDEDNYAQARELYERSLKLSEELGEPDLILLSRHLVGVVAYHEGAYDEARRLMEQSLREEQARGDVAAVARTQRRLAAVARMQGHYASAAERRRYFEEARRLLGESLNAERSLRSQARALRQLGMVAQEEGRLDEALKHYSKSLDLFARLSNKKGTAAVKCNLGSVYLERRNLDQAERLGRESLEMARELRCHYGEALTLRLLAWIAQKRHNAAVARALLDEAVRILESIHSRHVEEFKAQLNRLV